MPNKLQFGATAGVLSLPSTTLGWGATTIGGGFALLAIALATSYRLRGEGLDPSLWPNRPLLETACIDVSAARHVRERLHARACRL